MSYDRALELIADIKRQHARTATHLERAIGALDRAMDLTKSLTGTDGESAAQNEARK